jgi:ligand-binding SRPBCC domain-containing protein
MDCPYSFTMASHLLASSERVWAHASAFPDINRELRPLLRMSYPPHLARITPETFPLGKVAFRSWILLFGLIPVEYDDITLVELAPGKHFAEASRLLSMREWRHRRVVTPEGSGCVIQDEVAFTPRWRLCGPVQLRLSRLLFQLRHRALRRLFGDAGRRGAVVPPAAEFRAPGA